VPPLPAHLGEAAKFIDLIVEQAPNGLEVLRGSSTYVYDGNWKLQTENGADGYHVSTVHWNYVATTERRKQAEQPDNVRAMNLSGIGRRDGGFYSFANGHLVLWGDLANPEDRPNWERREELAARFDQSRRLDRTAAAQSLPLSECLSDGPDEFADPHLPAYGGR
jgi:benzoate/toluate 1,2-dioxygenase subunit alpha